ncbi:MAG: hypothetical protein QGF46_04835 [Planctomycetota bacterium]|nr:hypothetical protein [Planctomycetota bacterium]
MTYICSSINQSSFSYVKYPKLTSVRDLPSLLKSLLNETFPFSGLQQQPSYQILSLAAFQDLVLWRMNKYAASILPLEEDSDILNIDKLFEDNMNLLDRFSDEEVSILQDYDANLSIYDISNKYHQSEAGVVRVIHRLVGQINDAV